MTTLQSVESALGKDQTDLAEHLLTEKWNRLGPAEVFYQVIRDDLHLVFKLLESPLSALGIDERETFRLCANALAELRVKNVMVSEEMALRVLFKCSAYGLRNMSGDPVEAKSTNYWRESIALVDGWVWELRKRKQWYEYLDVDDEVIFTMRMIHNQLFFVKDHPLMKQMPLKEMIFCLAVFVESVNEIHGSDAFKMVINKRNVMKYLMAIVSRLRMVKNESIGKPKRSSVLKQLRKTYRRLKQMYSVFKILRWAKIYEETTASDYKRSNAFVTVAAFKRFNQICGEAIKNTQDTPNLSAKLSGLLPVLLDDSAALSSKYRNFSSHGFHLSQLYLRDTDEVYYYERLSDFIYITAVGFYLICAYVLHDCTRHLYGTLRRCRTIEEVRAVIRYVGSNNVKIVQEGVFRKIDQYLDIIRNRLTETNKESLSDKQLQDFDELWDNYLLKVETIDNMRELHWNHFLETIQVIAFSDASVRAVHRFIDSKLTDFSSGTYFEQIFTDWNLLSVVAVESVEYDAAVMQLYIQRYMELDRESVEQWRYREKTREIVAFFSEGCNLDRKTICDLEEKLHAVLSKPRNGYYQNIFSLDSKAQAISQILKEVIVGSKTSRDFKLKNKNFKSKLQALRLRDEQELSEVFHAIIANLQKVFKRFNCETIDKFIENHKTIPVNAQLAIQYWQLQAMEILCSCGYFGDNFGVLTRSIPLIWGKSYRNYLAHDELSYDLLSDSDSIKKMINGFVLARDAASLNIFAAAPNYRLDGLVQIEKKGFRWLAVQRKLFDSVWNCDKLAVEKSFLEKAELSSRLLRAPGFLLRLKYYVIPELMIHRIFSGVDVNALISLLREQFHNIEEFLKYSKIRHAISLNLKMFDNIPIEEAMQQFKLIQPPMTSPGVGALLPFLVKNDNFPLLEEMLESYAGSNIRLALLMTFGRSEMERDFLQTNLGTSTSVISEMSDETLRELFTEEYPASSYELGICIVRNDERIFNHILFECYGTLKSSLEEADLAERFEECCTHGRLSMANSLINMLGSENNEPMLEECLTLAVSGQSWKIADFLLDNEADPWYDNGGNLLITLMEGNFKLARKMLSSTIPEELTKKVVNWVAKHGSRQLLSFTFSKEEVNIWNCAGIIESASKNKHSEMFDYVQEQIFELDFREITNGELALWLKVINDFRIAMFLTTSDWLPAIGSNGSVLKRIVEKMDTSLRTDDHLFAEHFHFEDMSGLICSKLPHDQLLILEDQLQQTTEKCSDFVRHIKTLPTGLIVKKKSCFVTFLCPDDTFNASVELTIHSSDRESSIIEDAITVPLEDHYHKADAISMGMRSYLLKFRFMKAATAIITIKYLDQRYRYLQVDSSSCIVQEAPLPNLKFRFLLNRSFQHSILHFLRSDTPPDLLKTLLRLGADPTITDNKNRTPFRMLLVDNNFPLELIQLLYQHCQDQNATHLPNGTHILNAHDDDGYGPLHAAIGTNNYEAAEFLLQNGAEPTFADRTGEAAVLEYAVLNRNVRIVRLLLKYNPNLVNMLSNTARRRTVLEIAVKINHEHLVAILLEHGACMTHRNSDGYTPLKYAIEKEAIESMQVLLDFALRNGDVIQEDIDGCGTSALEFAREKEVDFEVLRLLVLHEVLRGAVSLGRIKQKCNIT